MNFRVKSKKNSMTETIGKALLNLRYATGITSPGLYSELCPMGEGAIEQA